MECDREPIHIPGSIQPHVVMLVTAPGPDGLHITACSDNASNVFGGWDAPRLLGQRLDVVLPPFVMDPLLTALGNGRLNDPARPFRLDIRLKTSAAQGHRSFAFTSHCYDERVIIELEQTSDRPADFNGAAALDAQHAISGLRAATTLLDAANVAAFEIRSMTRFERVLVYRFDADWNGEAVAEAKDAGWGHSLLGLRFPASDIPAQARALYTRSQSRFVVDRDARASMLLKEDRSDNQAVDLSFAHSRSLSPVHLEYQRNLGVNGSMSIAILVEDRLWGLIIGHHREPHYVTPDTRALTAVVADAFALRIHELESRELWRDQQATLAMQNRLVEQMAASDDFLTALTSGDTGATLLDLFAAGGAAVVSAERCATVGETPSHEAIFALAVWLRLALGVDQHVFATAHLAGTYKLGVDIQRVASGVLAAFINDGADGRGHILMWFRPELVSTIVWGGDPAKQPRDDETGAVLPRRSFERWAEERRGWAEPWETWREGAAQTLAAAIEGVILRQGRRIAELTAKHLELGKALQQKDVLAREIDHRVKNSLQIVGSMILLQARDVTDPSSKSAFKDTYARVMSVARVHESLHQSADVQSVDLGVTLRKLCDDLALGMMGAERRLVVSAEVGLMVLSQTAVALSLIATELVTNALKYAYGFNAPGEIKVSMRALDAGRVELRVSDRGRGLSTDALEGTKSGLGIRIIEAMLGQIGAQMTVTDNAPGVCSTVTTAA